MNFFARRKWKKAVRHALHDARHARHMREDIAVPADVENLKAAEQELKDAWSVLDEAAMERAMERVGAAIDKVYPPRVSPKIRENVEIIAVALAVAMGFRTYFIQPFKIPTGSMQPTLNGITVAQDVVKTIWDQFPLSLVRMAVFGERYVEIKAKVTGTLSQRIDRDDEFIIYYINNIPHRVRQNMMLQITSPYVTEGQVLAAGRVKIGDHIFVNKVRYNFSRPERGDIFVFSTHGIKDERIRPDTFYIKRMAGMPNERISIDPPYLVANGEKVTEPFAFHRLVHDTEHGYVGYQLPKYDFPVAMKIGSRADHLDLGPDEYLPLGDNTMSSLDGRYFGAVKEQNIVGPAFMVYWPFSSHWGLVQ